MRVVLLAGLLLRGAAAFALPEPFALGVWRLASPEAVVRSAAVGVPNFRVLDAGAPYVTEDGFAVIRLACAGGLLMDPEVFVCTRRRDTSLFVFKRGGHALALARVVVTARPGGGYALRGSLEALRPESRWLVRIWGALAPAVGAWNALADLAVRSGVWALLTSRRAAAEAPRALAHLARYRRLVLFLMPR